MRTTEADNFVQACSEAAESSEIMKRDLERHAAMAQREKEESIASIYEMAGRIKAMNFSKTQADFFRLVMLKQVKDSKEYRNRFDMSWEKFCEYVGVNRRWVDEQLADLKPFKVDFLEAFLQFSGTPINKIKYLGEAITEENSGIEISDNAIIYNGETIPLDAEHRDDIQALLENLEENHKKQIEEHAATVKTKDRLLKSKEEVINKMEKEIQHLEKKAPRTDLTEEEQELMALLEDAQLTILDRLFDCRAQVGNKNAPAIVQAGYYMLLIFIQKITADHRQDFNELYTDAKQMPFEITDWELPAEHIMVDHLPCSRGMGAKYKEFMDKRNAPKEK